MKLILCSDCQDIVPLTFREVVECQCGLSGGRYLTPEVTEYWGENVIPLGISNQSLADAITKCSDNGASSPFDAFVMGESDRMVRVEPPPNRDIDPDDPSNWDEIIKDLNEAVAPSEAEAGEDEDDNYENDERTWIKAAWSWIEENPDTHVAADLDSGLILISEQDENIFHKALARLLKEDDGLEPFTFYTTDLLCVS